MVKRGNLAERGLYWTTSVLRNLKGHRLTIEQLLEAWSQAEEVDWEKETRSDGFRKHKIGVNRDWYKYDEKTHILFRYNKYDREILVITIYWHKKLEEIVNIKVKKRYQRVCWTTHALKRVSEHKLKIKTIMSSWERATEIQLGERLQTEKFQKYGMSSLEDIFKYDKGTQVLFNCRKHRDYILIVTLTRGVKTREYIEK